MRTAKLGRFTPSNEIDNSNQELPQRALLRALLSRAVYDLTPETSIEHRRDAIRWFEAKEKEDLKDATVTSWQRVKVELNLGFKFLKLVKEVLSDAKAFQRYALNCKDLNVAPDTPTWVGERKQYRILNRKPGMPNIAFRKSSFIEVIV